jgi:hypothetical protein
MTLVFCRNMPMWLESVSTAAYLSDSNPKVTAEDSREEQPSAWPGHLVHYHVIHACALITVAVLLLCTEGRGYTGAA